MNKRERDRISSLVWLVLALGICIGSFKLSLGDIHRPGPGFFSFLAGAILGILSFLVFIQSFKGHPADERKYFWPNPQRSLKMTFVIIAFILYTIGMNYLGFFISTLLFLGFLMRGVGSQRWIVVLTLSIVTTVLSYVIFQYWLNVQLPRGILVF